ncbi:MAG: hypothetical protein DMG95_00180 [Acidobacteria bacterium]|nr:MAG: hypothetical protein DMG95_00180 [Acidobacteriota bacterium]
MGALDYIQRGLGDFVRIVHLKCRDSKRIVTGGKICVMRHALFGGFIPVFIKALQHVAEADSFLRAQEHDAIMQL